ncbi:MAG: hypothetical protein AB1424_05295 [Thermodesulfobacteriota bacterium]
MGYLDPNLFGIVAQVVYLIITAVVSYFILIPKKIRTNFINLFKKQKTPRADKDVESETDK